LQKKLTKVPIYMRLVLAMIPARDVGPCDARMARELAPTRRRALPLYLAREIPHGGTDGLQHNITPVQNRP
jgi:hypothetical protein